MKKKQIVIAIQAALVSLALGSTVVVAESPNDDRGPMNDNRADRPNDDRGPMNDNRADRPNDDRGPMNDSRADRPNDDDHIPSKLEKMGIKPGKLKNFGNLRPEERQIFGASDMKNVPNQAFQKMKPEYFKDMPRNAINGITPEQFREIPPNAIGGFGFENMVGLSSDVISEFEPEHLDNIDKDQFK
ncbi:MAG TPA: hypothetical protein ENK59_07510, partial [Thioploca sp.]|nr:hypothetical protein [Thioploca sp.]